jgi:4-hydroxy-tetrahydrodipicolinate synthase
MSLAIKGIIPAMVTPFHKNGEVNEEVLRQLVNHLIDGGVHGLFPIGSQGEFFALTLEEKRRVLEIVVEETRGRVPVYAGTGALTTADAVAATKMAEEVGADAVSVITPYFISPNEQELYEHFAAIANAVEIPVLLYNSVGRTGVNISADLVERLAKIDNVKGIKDSSGDLTLTGEYLRRTPDTFSVLVGRDTLIYAALCMGGKGSITATANVAPRLVSEIYDAFVEGDFERSLECQKKLAPLRIAFGLGTFPVVVKEALTLIGIEAGPCRKPVGPMSDDKRAELRDVLQGMGFEV